MPNSHAVARRGEECPRCGDIHMRCIAHNGTGKACKLNPMHGQQVCHRHGGTAPQNRVKGELRYRAAQLVQGQEITSIEDNVQLFREIIAEAAAMKDLCARQLEEGFREQDPLKVAGAMNGLATSIDRVGRLVKDFETLGLEERKVRLAEVQAAKVADALYRSLKELGLNPRDKNVQKVVKRNLLRLTS